jgi:P-type Cu+ transporter
LSLGVTAAAFLPSGENMKLPLFAFLACACSVTANAADPTPAAATKATYSITGMHCPPCTKTVENALRKTKGIKSAKVDWASRSAQVEFDESTISAQQISQTVRHTSHMMGAGMSYGSWLALSVPDVKDDASAETVKKALKPIAGVSSVATNVKQHTVSVEFSDKGSAATKELIAALKTAGFDAKTY